MDPKKLFLDERLKGICAYCGSSTNSRDHVPSRILLDEPYPENLPVVESCSTCNSGFSIDEEYVACLIECVIQGTSSPNDKFREKVIRMLKARPSLAARIDATKSIDEENNLIWRPDNERVRKVILKLARGHMSYELGVQHIEEPQVVEVLAIPAITKNELFRFNSIDEDQSILYPEIGSRSFINLLSGKPTAYGGWHVVQNDRYRYAINQSCGDWVKFVISEYLACRVVWE